MENALIVRRLIDSTLTLQNALILIAFLALLLLKVTDFCNDPGLGWHLATGQYISEQQTVPKTDPFLFAQVKNPWVADQWLADLLFFEIKKIGDWPLLYLILMIAFVASFVIIPLYSQRRMAGSYMTLVAPLVIMFACLLGSIHFICRPVILSFICFSLLFNLLLLKGERSEWHFSFKENFFIATNMLLWANFHPSFILGFLLLALFLLQSYLQKGRDALIPCGVPLGIAALVSLINPAFLDLHESILFLGGSDFAQKYYQEWQAVTADDGLFVFLIGPLIIYLFTILLKNGKIHSKDTFVTLTFLIFCLASLKAVRFMPYYGISMIPVASAALDLLFNRITVLKRSLAVLEEREKSGLNPMFTFLGISVLILIFSFSGRLPFYQGTFGPNPQIFPIEALEKLTRLADQTTKPIKVLNEINFGGYITLMGQGRVQAYIDDRTSLFRDDFYFHYLNNFRSENIFTLARLLRADYILLQNSAMDAELINFLKIQHAHSVVHADDRSLLFKIKPAAVDL